VLIDTPPILQVGDAMALAPQVDGILVVCRLFTANRHMLDELRRALNAAPAPKLGFVLTDANVGEGYGYGYGGYGYADGSGRSRDRASSEQVSTP
jgi:Mrp family chromosome partitioning ATPase